MDFSASASVSDDRGGFFYKKGASRSSRPKTLYIKHLTQEFLEDESLAYSLRHLYRRNKNDVLSLE